MMAPDRSLLRDIYWQMPLGFFLGVFFGLIAINLVGIYWPIAIILMSLWNALWVYLSESSPALRISCRITSIVPLSLLTLAGSGEQDMVPTVMVMLLSLDFVGIWGFVLFSCSVNFRFFG